MWQDIDNRLLSSGSDYAVANARVKFAKKLTGNETFFTLHEGNHKITFGLNGAIKKTAGVVTNFTDDAEETKLQKLINLEKLSSEILYADILNGVDLQYEVVSTSIKENLVVKERREDYVFAFTMALNNLTAVLDETGDIVLFDPDDGTVVYAIPAGGGAGVLFPQELFRRLSSYSGQGSYSRGNRTPAKSGAESL